jgi:transposase IS116/IS110/IS902 family protein
VYAPRYCTEWLVKITEAGVRYRAELYDQQFDVLAALRQEARRELLVEGRKHCAHEITVGDSLDRPHPRRSVDCSMQTPQRFRAKRQLWAYCGLALKTYTSGEYRFVGGQLKRCKKVLAIRGLNKNHNRD